MPDSSEGAIVMTNESIGAKGAGTVRTGEFQGSGPAPF
jgi:hypothetical protein